jgi:hypothetical protein
MKKIPSTGPTWPPAGLDRTTPREVHLTSGGVALMVLAVACWLGAPALLVGLRGTVERQQREERVLREQGQTTTAEVTRVWSSGSGSKKRWWMSYRFAAAAQTYEGRVRLGRSSSRAPGETLRVRYLPANPHVHALADQPREAMPAGMPYVASAGVALLGVLLLVPIHGERRLLIEGRAARARVTRHRKTQHGAMYEYEFAVLSGGRRTGLGRSVTRALPPIGAEIPVIYDNDEPKRSAPYPFLFVAPVHTARLR